MQSVNRSRRVVTPSCIRSTIKLLLAAAAVDNDDVERWRCWHCPSDRPISVELSLRRTIAYWHRRKTMIDQTTSAVDLNPTSTFSLSSEILFSYSQSVFSWCFFFALVAGCTFCIPQSYSYMLSKAIHVSLPTLAYVQQFFLSNYHRIRNTWFQYNIYSSENCMTLCIGNIAKVGQYNRQYLSSSVAECMDHLFNIY